ncbi:hypothetical protein HK096_003961, partial [Nowakowskiella sp. JEL0078]
VDSCNLLVWGALSNSVLYLQKYSSVYLSNNTALANSWSDLNTSSHNLHTVQEDFKSIYKQLGHPSLMLDEYPWGVQTSNPTPLVPKHTLHHSPSLPVLPQWGRIQGARRRSPSPKDSKVLGEESEVRRRPLSTLVKPNEFSAAATKQSSPLGTFVIFWVLWGFLLCGLVLSLALSLFFERESKSANWPSNSKHRNSLEEISSITQASAPVSISRTDSSKHQARSLSNRIPTSSPSSILQPHTSERPRLIFSQQELDAFILLIEQSRQTKNQRWKPNSPVAVWPSWQDAEEVAFGVFNDTGFNPRQPITARGRSASRQRNKKSTSRTTSRASSIMGSPMLLPSISGPLAGLDFRSPSPMFSLDGYEDSDNMLTEFLDRFTDVDETFSDSASVSSRANSSVAGIRRAARMGFGRFGVGDELSSWNSNAVIKPQSATADVAAGSNSGGGAGSNSGGGAGSNSGGGGESGIPGSVVIAAQKGGSATITRSLSDGDLMRLAKTVCNFEMQKMIGELSGAVERQLAAQDEARDAKRLLSPSVLNWNRLKDDDEKVVDDDDPTTPTAASPAFTSTTPPVITSGTQSPFVKQHRKTTSWSSVAFSDTQMLPPLSPPVIQDDTASVIGGSTSDVDLAARVLAQHVVRSRKASNAGTDPQTTPLKTSTLEIPNESEHENSLSDDDDIGLDTGFSPSDFSDDSTTSTVFVNAISDLISVAQHILDLDNMLELMSPLICRKLIAELLELQTRWNRHPDWPCKEYLIRMLVVFANVARLVELFEEDTRLYYLNTNRELHMQGVEEQMNSKVLVASMNAAAAVARPVQTNQRSSMSSKPSVQQIRPKKSAGNNSGGTVRRESARSLTSDTAESTTDASLVVEGRVSIGKTHGGATGQHKLHRKSIGAESNSGGEESSKRPLHGHRKSMQSNNASPTLQMVFAAKASEALGKHLRNSGGSSSASSMVVETDVVLQTKDKASTLARSQSGLGVDMASGTSGSPQSPRSAKSNPSLSSVIVALDDKREVGSGLLRDRTPRSSLDESSDNNGKVMVQKRRSRRPSTLLHTMSSKASLGALQSSSIDSQTLNVMMELSLDGKVLYLSPACETVFGYEADQVVEASNSTQKSGESGASVVSQPPLFLPSDHPDSSVFMRATRVLLDDEDSTLEIRYRARRCDGRWLEMEGKGMLVYDRTTGVKRSTIWVTRPVGLIGDGWDDIPQKQQQEQQPLSLTTQDEKREHKGRRKWRRVKETNFESLSLSDLSLTSDSGSVSDEYADGEADEEQTAHMKERENRRKKSFRRKVPLKVDDGGVDIGGDEDVVSNSTGSEEIESIASESRQSETSLDILETMRGMESPFLTCSICDREIPGPVFERHSETCLAVHRQENDIGLLNDELRDVKSKCVEKVKVLATEIEAESAAIMALALLGAETDDDNVGSIELGPSRRGSQNDGFLPVKAAEQEQKHRTYIRYLNKLTEIMKNVVDAVDDAIAIPTPDYNDDDEVEVQSNIYSLERSVRSTFGTSSPGTSPSQMGLKAKVPSSPAIQAIRRTSMQQASGRSSPLNSVPSLVNSPSVQTTNPFSPSTPTSRRGSGSSQNSVNIAKLAVWNAPPEAEFYPPGMTVGAIASSVFQATLTAAELTRRPSVPSLSTVTAVGPPTPVMFTNQTNPSISSLPLISPGLSLPPTYFFSTPNSLSRPNSPDLFSTTGGRVVPTTAATAALTNSPKGVPEIASAMVQQKLKSLMDQQEPLDTVEASSDQFESLGRSNCVDAAAAVAAAVGETAIVGLGLSLHELSLAVQSLVRKKCGLVLKMRPVAVKYREMVVHEETLKEQRMVQIDQDQNEENIVVVDFEKSEDDEKQKQVKENLIDDVNEPEPRVERLRSTSTSDPLIVKSAAIPIPRSTSDMLISNQHHRSSVVDLFSTSQSSVKVEDKKKVTPERLKIGSASQPSVSSPSGNKRTFMSTISQVFFRRSSVSAVNQHHTAENVAMARSSPTFLPPSPSVPRQELDVENGVFPLLLSSQTLPESVEVEKVKSSPLDGFKKKKDKNKGRKNNESPEPSLFGRSVSTESLQQLAEKTRKKHKFASDIVAAVESLNLRRKSVNIAKLTRLDVNAASNSQTSLTIPKLESEQTCQSTEQRITESTITETSLKPNLLIPISPLSTSVVLPRKLKDHPSEVVVDFQGMQLKDVEMITSPMINSSLAPSKLSNLGSSEISTVSQANLVKKTGSQANLTNESSEKETTSARQSGTSRPVSMQFPNGTIPRNTPSIKDFEIVKPISKGAFGSVYLAKKKTSGEYFAIKVLKKADMIAKNQVTNVKAERMILTQIDSPYVVKLFFSFQTKDNLYLVMEYLNGGDCASLVKGVGNLDEKWAKQYIAEVVLGLEFLHARGIVH